jgi:DNA-binding NtrC family response regulator
MEGTIVANARQILVVDDEPRIGDSLTFLLSHHGFPTESCLSGAQAFARMERKDYDLVLLDIVMPEIDGLSVMDFIRRQHPETSIIFITGQATVATAVQALRNGVCDYLTKPISETELVEAIQRAFRESRSAALKTTRPADEKLLPICASCKRIRDAAGGWQSMESFFTACYPVRFSHTICKECSKTLYPDVSFLDHD